MKKKKILYGIAGIGLGHTYRQLPIIEYLAKKYLLVIFAYDKSYEFYSSHFKNRKSVYVERVAVPFFRVSCYLAFISRG